MLCILTFSVLTLVTANSDYKLSKKYAEKNTSYYEAEAVAYSTLSSIDSQLYNIYRRSVSAEDYFNIITTELNIDSKHKGLKASENGNLYYDFDIETPFNNEDLVKIVNGVISRITEDGTMNKYIEEATILSSEAVEE